MNKPKMEKSLTNINEGSQRAQVKNILGIYNCEAEKGGKVFLYMHAFYKAIV
jgi:hypothetical protein